ncbi:MAG TPA: penicillin acylase family protein [Thermoanaerobaculia bacterium]
MRRTFIGERCFPLRPALLTLFLCLLAGACSSLQPAGDRDGDEDAPAVTIIRTAYGIPHITAHDLESLAYGLGYAYAQDNFCMLAEKINEVNGERSRHFGAGVGQSTRNFASDFYYRSQLSKQGLVDHYRRESPQTAQLTQGYAAGVNRYLAEIGLAALPQPCRNAAWVRPIDEGDLYLWYTAIATIAASQPMLEAIVAAKPPIPGEPAEKPSASIAPVDLQIAGEAMAAPSGGGLGSNAWAFGREATSDGRGLLFGNPHWAWGTMSQFYQVHLTIPGSLDVMGVAYGGAPMMVIGFNRSLAWSHTVSTGARMVFRELTLAERSPTTYLVDGEPQEMEAKEVVIDVLRADGTIGQERRTFYSTRFGPVIVREGMPWTASSAWAMTDLNLPNRRLADQWLAMSRSESTSELRRVLEGIQGVPWVNTIAADADGNTLYADYSIKPYVTDEMLTRCARSETAKRITQSGTPALDGSTTSCDPLTDPRAQQQGILPISLLPVLERDDYVANSNNTYWLTNPAAPITGLPTVNGRARTALDFRAQSGLRIIEARLAGRDGLPGNRFDRDAVKALVFGHPADPIHGNRNRAAEVVLDAVLEVCNDGPSVEISEGKTTEVTDTCRVLRAWDRRHATTSIGAHVWREVSSATRSIRRLWSVPFDAADPLNTPREPNLEDVEVRTALRRALGTATEKFASLGVPLDRSWGEIHRHRIGDRLVGVPGNVTDVLNMMIAPQLNERGYEPIEHGTSYVQIVGFDENGPVADAVLLYGQSSNPESPWYHDQLESLWLQGRWNRLPFHDADVRAAAVETIRLRR